MWFWVKTFQTMNKLAFLVGLIALTFSCSEAPENQPTVNRAVSELSSKDTSSVSTDTVQIDLDRSKIMWKATKMAGTAGHAGQISLTHGFLTTTDGLVSGGSFKVDINSIQVTDIPESEPIPRKRFNDHIKSNDFFNAAVYPTASFRITRIDHINPGKMKVNGDLTIKNITKSISFPADQKQDIIMASVKFDRFKWNITSENEEAGSDSIDAEVQLTIELITR